MPSWKKVITSGSDASLNSLNVTNGITGSLLGTASYAATASYVNPLNQNVQLTGSLYLSAPEVASIYFSGSSAASRLVWNNTDGTLDLGLKDGNVTLQIGQEQVTRVVNKTATNINLLEANYQAVRITGAQGQRLKVDLAQATNDALSAETIGLVTETINNNQEGFITTSGLIRGINTTGTLQGETWSNGDVVYLSPTTAGNITNIKPVAPNHLVIIGFVVHAHGTQGTIFVKVDNGYEIDELHNVKITTGSLTPGQLLVRSGSNATGVWINTNQLTGSYGLTGSLTATSFTGSLLGTASYATQALSASYAPGGGNPFPFNGNAQISGSLTVTGSLLITGSSTLINQGPTILSGSFKVQGEGDGVGGPITTAITVDDINFTRKLHDSQTGSGSLDFGIRDLLDGTGNGVFNWNGIAATIDARLYLNQTIGAGTRDLLITNIGYGGFSLNDVSFDSGVQDFDLVFLDTDGIWYQVNQTTNTSTKMLGICQSFNPMTNIGIVITEGDIVITTGAGYPQVAGANYGLPVYIKESDGTLMSTTIPTTGYVRLLGHCYYTIDGGTEWIMKFRPSHEWIEL